MAQSLSKIYLHIVFSTKERIPYITPSIENRLHSYIVSLCKDHNCFVHEVNGMSDHIHILLEQSKTISVSDLLLTIKANLSRWIKQADKKILDFAWQNGYGVFSVDESTFDPVKLYIKNQKHHHIKKSFKEEFLQLLNRAKIEYNELYLWN